VTLTTGEVLPADVYLSVVGVKPGLDFLTGSGIAIETGVVVDEHLRTNIAGVYAVGDVAESPTSSTANARSMPSSPMRWNRGALPR
jgi:NAD(P)H-nitrite reductase large subunit